MQNNEVGALRARSPDGPPKTTGMEFKEEKREVSIEDEGSAEEREESCDEDNKDEGDNQNYLKQLPWKEDWRQNVPCKHFERGWCRMGTSCPFQHGEDSAEGKKTKR